MPDAHVRTLRYSHRRTDVAALNLRRLTGRAWIGSRFIGVENRVFRQSR
jgi:hypothetical protein